MLKHLGGLALGLPLASRCFGNISFLSIAGAGNSPGDFPELFPFTLSHEAPDNIANFKHLLSAPAGKNGFIKVKDGRMADGRMADGRMADGIHLRGKRIPLRKSALMPVRRDRCDVACLVEDLDLSGGELERDCTQVLLELLFGACTDHQGGDAGT